MPRAGVERYGLTGISFNGIGDGLRIGRDRNAKTR